MKWIEVCDVSAISPDDLMSVEVAGVAITICLVEGQYWAFSTICTHERVSLADGYLEGCEIECPLHGARFDVRNGRCMSPPATKDLQTFPTKVENSKLYVQVEEQ